MQMLHVHFCCASELAKAELTRFYIADISSHHAPQLVLKLDQFYSKYTDFSPPLPFDYIENEGKQNTR